MRFLRLSLFFGALGVFFTFPFSTALGAIGASCGTGGVCRAGNGCLAGEQLDTTATQCALTENCCKAQTTPSNSSTTGGDTYENPLIFTDVRSFFIALLGAVQGFIVVLAIIFIIIGALIYITSGGNEKRIEWAKHAILAAAIGLAIVIAAPLLLREVGTILGWTSTSSDLTRFGTQLSLSQVLANVLSFLLGILGVVALIALVLGGFMYITSAGDTDRADFGKKLITYALIGLTVSLAALVIIHQVATFFSAS